MSLLLSSFAAGHTEHERTSATAFESVFEYLQDMRKRMPSITDVPLRRGDSLRMNNFSR
jgi:hypothetical protein